MRLLLVEDDDLLGDGIKTALMREGYVVEWLQSGRNVVDYLCREDFSVVVLDLGLPDIDGMQLLIDLRRKSHIPVLIMTARDAVEERIKGLDAGADDYVLKPCDLQELLARLRVIMRRAEGRATKLLDLGALVIDESQHQVHWHGNRISLGGREYALLLELARHHGKVMTRERLESLLYGLDDEPVSNAVEVHVHYLRKKLDRHVIETVRGIGYRLDCSAR